MTDRERLLELIGRVQDEGRDYSDVVCSYRTSNESLADYLIANGVKIPIRCKDCKHCDPENRHCDHPMGTEFPFPRKAEDFCSYGERKNNGKE